MTQSYLVEDKLGEFIFANKGVIFDTITPPRLSSTRELQVISTKITRQVQGMRRSGPEATCGFAKQGAEKIEVTAPDSVMLQGTLTNGAAASIHISTIGYHGSGSRLEVYGTEGTIVGRFIG